MEDRVKELMDRIRGTASAAADAFRRSIMLTTLATSLVTVPDSHALPSRRFLSMARAFFSMLSAKPRRPPQ